MASSVEVTDEALVQRVQAGDKKAFDLLVLKYQNRVIHLVNRYLRDQSEAQDVAQDAFIKAYRAIGSFRGESAFYTWIYRIAINTAKNHIVSRSRRPSEEDIDPDVAEQFEGVDSLRDIDTPDAILLSEEMAVIIQNALDDLPSELRTAISLREFDGLSYEEIAEAMSCPVGTVRSRIFRAREFIEKRLESVEVRP
ncbi:RNA polymerase sigma factor RpoE [Candidatus Methylospira mobilis]|uniref:RNA polymerase sigma factor RpoE n=1 Tax=Candidatus Methylospira mobilis TaxID=1808979 RepID=UPI001D174188|nr:RNA polymerase sigma factor RpoE [Candidatus Methylospira mobilis]WNV03860.1 RNA polymerase sigma factor RpoE [Candidatus Methylospira mobilis]